VPRLCSAGTQSEDMARNVERKARIESVDAIAAAVAAIADR
jgi:hypothetical protein